MELRIRETGEVITESEFRRRHSNTSFPKVISRETMNNFGVDPVFEGPAATTTPPYEYSVRDGVYESNGEWYTRYVVGPVFTDMTDENGQIISAAQQRADYEANLDASQAVSVRQIRNAKLQLCDWTHVTDSSLDSDAKSAWAAYRASLRAVPEQEGFPWNVTWPEEPS